MKVLAIQNCELEGFGRYHLLLCESGVDLRVAHAYRQDDLPDYHEFDAVLVGGTPISARVAAGHRFLRAESELLSRAIGDGVPLLGVCFGAQFLGQLLGGSVIRMPHPEIGLHEVSLTEVGREDPLLAGFPDHFAVFQWHGDTFSIPGGGQLLVSGKPCRNQMFRKGSAVGMHFHLEVSAEEARAWAAAYDTELADFGKTPGQLVAEVALHDREMADLAHLLIENLLKVAR